MARAISKVTWVIILIVLVAVAGSGIYILTQPKVTQPEGPTEEPPEEEPTPDFGISSSPSSLSIPQDNSGAVTVTVTSENGFNSTVSLSLLDAPLGVFAALNTTSLTPPADGNASSDLTLRVFPSATTGNFTLTVTGESESHSHSCTILLDVKPPASPLTYSGFRTVGHHGQPPDYWVNVAEQLASEVPNTTPGGVWIVGQIWSEPLGTCALYFPSSETYPNVWFDVIDRNEACLTAFDEKGVKVWLQVEPGFADVDLLIDLVLERYGHHPCVIGFGIDLEWYWSAPYETAPVTDADVQRWSKKIKLYNPNYKLYLAHWLKAVMPPTIRQDVVYIDDGQNVASLDSLLYYFKDWGEHFSQADVGYQVGYESDRGWWSSLENPPRDIGLTFTQNIPNTRAIYWVEDGIRELFPPPNPWT